MEEKEINKFNSDVSDIFNGFSNILTSAIEEFSYSIYSATFAMLRIAAMLSSNSGCNKKTFIALANRAYEQEVVRTELRLAKKQSKSN